VSEKEEPIIDKQPGRHNSTIVAVHNGKKINEIVSEKRINPRDVAVTIGYSKGNKNAYNRLIDGESALGLRGLSELAELLGVDVFDILQDEYKKKVANVRLVQCSNASDVNKFLHDYEKQYGGRTAIFNSFPSLLYYADNDQARCARHGYLIKRGVKNHEYYPLRSVLRFGFSEFSVFSISQKIKILNEFIGSFGSSKDFRVFVVVDDDGFMYSPFASDCEILGEEVLIISAPFYQNSLIVIKSSNTIEDILENMSSNPQRIMDENRVEKMLSILLRCLEDGACLPDFVLALKEEKSKFYRHVVNVLSDDMKKKLD